MNACPIQAPKMFVFKRDADRLFDTFRCHACDEYGEARLRCDDYCVACTVEFWSENPEEFEDAWYGNEALFADSTAPGWKRAADLYIWRMLNSQPAAQEAAA